MEKEKREGLEKKEKERKEVEGRKRGGERKMEGKEGMKGEREREEWKDSRTDMLVSEVDKNDLDLGQFGW